jgi:hypothetical protein
MTIPTVEPTDTGKQFPFYKERRKGKINPAAHIGNMPPPLALIRRCCYTKDAHKFSAPVAEVSGGVCPQWWP